MTEHKFTDEEIVEVLNAYVSKMCGKCNVKDLGVCCSSCYITVISQALDLINRQKEEIEVIKETTAEIRYEAVKEFAEYLKKYYRHIDKTAGALIGYTIDQKVKEFLGGNVCGANTETEK